MAGSRTSVDAAIRSIRPDDKARVVDAFEALEPQTLYQRFFFPKKMLSDEELRRLTEPDRAREAVLVAVIGAGGDERIVGLGRYVRSGAGAHVAFTVEEDYQGRGIATRLLRKLARIAQRNGIRQLEADVLADNGPMLSVLRHSGLPVAERAQDGVVHATLTLGAPADPAAPRP